MDGKNAKLKTPPESAYAKALLTTAHGGRSAAAHREPTALERAGTRLFWELGRGACDMLSYARYARACAKLAESPTEAALNPELSGYPRNHDYKIASGRLVAGKRLFSRWRMLSALFSDDMDSFLDIGSSKGFFVFGAAMRPGCSLACGIDLHEPFIETSSRARAILGIGNASFHLASVEEVAKEPERFGAPFHTVMLVNTYHYLYWGSGLVDKSENSHDRILGTLAKICSRRLLFSNPLEVRHATGEIKKRAEGKKHDYTTAAFMEAAQKHFTVTRAGSLGQTAKRPLLVLEKKP